MLVLAIDTSTNTAACALLDDEEIKAEYFVNVGKNHSATLLPSIEHMLSVAGCKMADIDLYACTMGPGSFTGLRIGAATVKGFALASGKPVVGVSTLDALACNMSAANMTICPMLDARKSQVYTALYKISGERYDKASEEKATEIEPFVRGIQDDCIFLGDGATVYRPAIEKILKDRAFFASPLQHSIRAAAVGLLGLTKFRRSETLDKYAFAPRYLRVSEAEMKR